MKSPTITVIVPTYRREEPLRQCLGDVLAQDTRPNAIVVVDQTPSHEPVTQAFMDAHAHEFVWIRHPTPNLPGARNIGLSHCHTDIVLFLDDDARVGPQFVGNHLKNYSDPSTMAVAGPVLESLESWMDTLPSFANEPFEQHFTSCWQYNKRRTVLHAPGGNMSFRMALIPTVGEFDSHYQGPAFREETDFFLRVSAAGHTIMYDPNCWILHKGGPKAGGCWDEQWRRQLELRSFNEAYFAVKNFHPRFWPYFFWKGLRYASISRNAMKNP